MILDLHTHSIKSDDGRARVETYCGWIRKRELQIEGFVLTEHRQFDDESDYRPLEHEFGLRILKGSEVETDYGHVLVFGVNDRMRAAFDLQTSTCPSAWCWRRRSAAEESRSRATRDAPGSGCARTSRSGARSTACE